jgi:hypothetical protein
MDFGFDQRLSESKSNELLDLASRIRLSRKGPAVGAGARRAKSIGSAVSRAVQATLRCRWDDVDSELQTIRDLELVPAAQVSVEAMAALAKGNVTTGRENWERLRHIRLPVHADAHVWASGMIATGLHAYLTGNRKASAEPVALVREMCLRSSGLDSETAGLLCLSLSLFAHVSQAPTLASFLLGHVSDAIGSYLRLDSDGSGAPHRLPAVPAAAGFAILTLGDRSSGMHVLVRAADDAARRGLPLILGIASAELARLGGEFADRQTLDHWRGTATRTASRFETRLPLFGMVSAAVRESGDERMIARANADEGLAVD